MKEDKEKKSKENDDEIYRRTREIKKWLTQMGKMKDNEEEKNDDDIEK